jgi:DNA-binding transcriptional ArsR family regulator
VFAPRERELDAVLERELMGLMHTLATVGVESMLTRVHPRITFTDGALRIPASPAPTETTDVTGRCLWLAPLLCGPDASMSTFGRPDLIVLGYPARGVASFWGDAAQPAPDGLEILLGATRARVAVAVAEPGTTSDLARELKVAPATVSHHLSALSEAGIVDSRRTGRRVYYALTGRGRRVIASFS